MTDSATQTFASHRRFDPAYHFLLVPVLVLNLGIAIATVARHPGGAAAWQVVVAAMLLLMAFQVRLYALKVQDRVIRLEEQLRLQSLLGEPLRGRIPELRARQLVGLRFASDAELPTLVQAALDEQLSGEQIKKRIQTWRPDTFRA